MAANGRTRILGFKECREALQALSKGVQRNVGKRSLVPAADVIAEAVKARAPVSDRARNATRGSLRDSVRVVPAKTERGRPRVAVLADDVAAAPNEFGTTTMAAQPFFRPAVEANRDRAAAVFGEALKGEVAAASARAAKRAGRG